MAPRSTMAAGHDETWHLVILDPTCSRVLMMTTARTWVLPFVRSRADVHPWQTIAERLTTLRVVAMPVHQGFVSESPQTQEGRPGAWHHYIVFVADAWPKSGPYGWVSPDDLLTTRKCPFPAQPVALTLCLQRIRHGVAPFDRPSELRAVCSWVEEEVQHALGAKIVGPPEPIRLGRCDLVLRFQTTKGPVIFKGGPQRTRRDAQFLRRLHSMSPTHFPALIAEDPKRNWWLMPGTAPPSAELDTDRAREASWFNAVWLLADTQRRMLGSPEMQEIVSAKPFGATQLDAALEQMQTLLPQGVAKASWPPERVSTIKGVLHRAVVRLMGHDLPWTWTPYSFTMANVQIGISDTGRGRGPTGGQGHIPGRGFEPGRGGDRDDDDEDVRGGKMGGVNVTFEDADECYFAPPTLALSQFLDDLYSRVKVPALTLVRLEQHYIDAWGGAITPAVLRRALADTHIAGLLFTFANHVDCLARVHGLDLRSPADLSHPELVEHAQRLGSRVPAKLPRQQKGRTSVSVLPDTPLPGWRGC